MIEFGGSVSEFAAFRAKTLAQRTAANPTAEIPALGMVMIDGPHAYRRFAEWIWQGAVQRVIHEWKTRQQRTGLPEKDVGEADPRQRIHRMLTYYTNHRQRMNYAEYRRQGLPPASSRIESAIEQIDARVEGTEKSGEMTTPTPSCQCEPTRSAARSPCAISGSAGEPT